MNLRSSVVRLLLLAGAFSMPGVVNAGHIAIHERQKGPDEVVITATFGPHGNLGVLKVDEVERPNGTVRAFAEYHGPHGWQAESLFHLILSLSGLVEGEHKLWGEGSCHGIASGELQDILHTSFFHHEPVNIPLPPICGLLPTLPVDCNPPGSGYIPPVDHGPPPFQSAVPEPSTFVLFGTGLLGLLAYRRFASHA